MPRKKPITLRNLQQNQLEIFAKLERLQSSVCNLLAGHGQPREVLQFLARDMKAGLEMIRKLQPAEPAEPAEKRIILTASEYSALCSRVYQLEQGLAKLEAKRRIKR